MQIGRSAMLGTSQSKTDHQGEKSECGEFQKTSAGVNAVVIQPGKEERDCQAKNKMRQVDRVISDAIKLDRIQRGEEISGNSPSRERFEWTGEEITKEHHPTGDKADSGGQDSCGVRDFACGVRN